LVQAIEAAAGFKQVALLGDHCMDVRLSGELISSILQRALTLYGSWNSRIVPPGRSEWQMVPDHVPKNCDVDPYISHTPALSDGPKLFDDLACRNIWYNKVVFAISEEAQKEAQGRV
jgi:L-iditol 2-dehydrogenase/galactitol-1-phosphate 5-dehydrogenase